MTSKEVKKYITSIRRQKQSYLNETYLWVSVAITAIQSLPRDRFEFAVPKARNASKSRTIVRNNSEDLINRIVKTDIYYSAYVSLLSSVEDYFSKIARVLLRYENIRLKCTVPGIDMKKDISIVDLIDAASIQEIIDDIIDQRLDSLFYASPKKQHEFFSKVLGIEINEILWGHWIEYKARRDVIVHNSGIYNEIYMRKTGEFSLGIIGEPVKIDDLYFRQAISEMKHLIGAIDILIKKEFKMLSNSKRVL